jgi:hypothetical protein
MKELKNKPAFVMLPLLISVCLGGCHLSRKIDAYVAEQYGNQLPKQTKNKKTDFAVSSSVPYPYQGISKTIKNKNKVLPLIVYWSIDYRHTCSLNPAIAVNNFANTINSQANKGLADKLKGRHLDLIVEQVPASFAIVDKGHILLFFTWDKLYVEPDKKDLVVSYKLTGTDSSTKSGKITISNPAADKNIRFGQSWKSSTSEFLTRYNAEIVTMTKSFLSKLVEEL